MEKHSSYRPHDPGHDYYAPGIYLITLVVRNRRENARMLGVLNDNPRQPEVSLTEMGKEVMRCWQEIPVFEQGKGRQVVIHTAVCMPDHFHGVIEVKERMEVSLGQVIWGFKVACTKRWRQCQTLKPQPTTAAGEKAAKVATTAAEEKAAKVTMTATEEKAAKVAMTAAEEKATKLTMTAAEEKAAKVAMTATYMATEGRAEQLSLVVSIEPDLHRMSKKQRAAYYAEHPEAQQPLWDDNYDDTICLSDPITGEYCQRHFTAMMQYVDDNARRAIIRRLYPQFFERCLHVRIGGFDADGRPVVRDYAAFGNLFLLRWAKKVQIFCHRLARRGMLTDEEWQKATGSTGAIRSFEEHTRKLKLGRFDREWYRCAHPATITAIDYTRTAAYREEHEVWVKQVMSGATAMVTPGISKGEQMMKDECIAKGYPLIHLQKEPIGAYWKPEKKRFDACVTGRLLILAPWKAETLGDMNGVPSATDYSVFHNLNRLAEELCLFDGEAMIVK